MKRTELHENWVLRADGDCVPSELVGRIVAADVPGTAHTALLAAGLIPDPYLDLNELEVQWAHLADWRYQRPVEIAGAAADERVDLVFEGLDTIAAVSLGDREVGRTRNQHRTYRFDIRDLAGHGPTTLNVAFDSALTSALAEQERVGARPRAYPSPMNMIRKMACSFGWDWGPDLQTAGIWRPVSLQRWRTARLASVRPLVSLDADGTAHVAVHVDVERSGVESIESALTIQVRLSDPTAAETQAGQWNTSVQVPPGGSTALAELAVPDPALWWPVGYGGQPLYDLDVTLSGGPVAAGKEPEPGSLDGWHRRIGLRTVELDNTNDEYGTAFVLRINDTPVFVRGANWIPDDHLLTRITRARLGRRIGQAVDANINLLRVWGGGIYESEDFYELCDEAGIMVWQDFLLACAAYPEEEPHRSEFEAEAREHVARLTPHPSLVLWNGGNENLWGFVDWGWREELEGRTWGLGYYTDVFPRVVAELDPTRPYCAGSPCSPGASLDEVHPNDPDHGTHHEWEVWNRVDYARYRADVPRFCSEFGFQAPPAWSTLERAVRNADGSPLGKDDQVWLLHQKAADGNGKLDRGLEGHLGIPTEFVDWHWATQLNQARAVTYAITHYRSWWPWSAGSIVWQLNDCWPVTSWAAIDGDEQLKPLWWGLRAAYADRILTVQPRTNASDGKSRLVVAVVNDSPTPWAGTLRASRQSLGGDTRAQQTSAVDVPPRSVELVELPVDVQTPGDEAGEVLVVELANPLDDSGLARDVHCWVQDKDLALDPAAAETTVDPVEGGYRVSVTARSLIKDLMVLADRVDPQATVDRGLVTLPAGAAITLTVRSNLAGLEDALTAHPVLRSANDLRPVRSGAATTE